MMETDRNKETHTHTWGLDLVAALILKWYKWNLKHRSLDVSEVYHISRCFSGPYGLLRIGIYCGFCWIGIGCTARVCRVRELRQNTSN